MSFIKYLNGLLWGPFGACLILGAGLYLLFKLKGFYLLHPLKTFKLTAKKSGLTAMLSALGGSIGVGNIVGVSVGISLGGAGAVFWMWVCALISAVLKYAEIYLSVKYKDRTSGGPMYYLRLCNIPYLERIFCVFCILSSFGIGSCVQSNAVAVSGSGLGISARLVGLLLCILCMLTFIGGGGGLQKICKIVVPVMSVLYIIGCTVMLGVGASRIPSVLSGIVKDALNLKSLGGGIGASMLVRSLRQGMSKGIFSAESGMGSSAITYSYNCGEKPSVQGIWGIFEVFIDTLVMCTLSALVILVSDKDTVFEAFSSFFGRFGGGFTFLSLFCFAYTSICCWNFYGASCVRFLTKRKGALFIYNALFLCSIFVGAISKIYSVWLVSDLCNALMLFLNCYGIVILSDRIRSPL